MVNQIALLSVKPDETEAFETAVEKAKGHMAGAEGFRSLDLQRSVGDPNRYLLVVSWEQVEDHTERFRGSPAHAEWNRLTHGFYDEPLPAVEYFAPVLHVE